MTLTALKFIKYVIKAVEEISGQSETLSLLNENKRIKEALRKFTVNFYTVKVYEILLWTVKMENII